MEIEIFSGDSSHLIFKVPVLKIKDYTIGEIFQKKLYLLIPFHIFRYENKLADYENDQYKLKKVKTYYAAIRSRLIHLAKEEKNYGIARKPDSENESGSGKVDRRQV